MGVPPYLSTSSVRAVLAQRLVRRICTQCQESYRPSVEEFISLGISTQQDFGVLYHGKGCENCDFTGYYGRTAIAELFLIDDEIRTLINTGASESIIREKAYAKGMDSLLKDGIRKVKEGKTTLQEVLKATGGDRAAQLQAKSKGKAK